MYLGELLQYYQSSNNLPWKQTLDFDLKFCFVLLNTCSRFARGLLALLARLVCTSIFLPLFCSTPRVNLYCFGLLNTSSLSARCWLFSTVSTFLAFCWTPRRNSSALCSLFSCLCMRLSKYSYFRRTGSCKLLSSVSSCKSNFLLLMFHSPELLSISSFFSSLSIRFLSSCFLYILLLLLSSVFTIPVPNLRTPSLKERVPYI